MARHNLRIQRTAKNAVLINGKRIRLTEYRGARPKCFYGDYIIKFDDDDDVNTADREVDIWRSLAHAHKKYFAKLVGWNVSAGYVIQEVVKFKRGRKTNAAKAIVQEMVELYDLEDVSLYGENSNWSIGEDGVPKIYDWAADW